MLSSLDSGFRRKDGLRDLKEDEALFDHGSSGDNVFIIASGEVEITRAGARLNTLVAGDCIGELSLLDEARNARSAAMAR